MSGGSSYIPRCIYYSIVVAKCYKNETCIAYAYSNTTTNQSFSDGESIFIRPIIVVRNEKILFIQFPPFARQSCASPPLSRDMKLTFVLVFVFTLCAMFHFGSTRPGGGKFALVTNFEQLYELIFYRNL